ncbi:MAG: hypothetical protein LUC30_03315 [Clostridiales bacterium]|nr:hypothetical protein [Clostridiales bacterium]
MGLREKYGKKLEMQGFEPIDLNETDVDVIFKKCLADENTTEKECSYLFSREYGYSKESEESVFFDRKRINENRNNILYLLGQTHPCHYYREENVTPKTISQKYNGEIWTRNNGIIMELLHLARAIDELSPFNKATQDAILLIMKTTLSPNDPNFPEWWKEHKSEWEDRKR